MSNSPDISRVGRWAKELRLLCVGFGGQESPSLPRAHPLVGPAVAHRAVFCEDPRKAGELIESQQFQVIILNVARMAASDLDLLFETTRQFSSSALIGVLDPDAVPETVLDHDSPVAPGPSSASSSPRETWIDVIEWIPTTAPPDALLLRLCASMSNEVRLLSALRAVKTEVQQQNRCDPLTGLASRDWLIERVNLSITLAREDRERGFALLYVDLDSFKMVNDSQGHGTGDRLLMDVASRITKTVRRSDVVARIGADEFIVLLEGNQEPEITMDVATQIQAAVARPCCVKDRTLYLSASIGAAHFQRHEHQDALDLLRDAATALHAAKNRGRGGQALFGNDLREQAVLLFDIENELPQAIANKKLRVYYQPIFCLKDQTLVGCEALVRWQHPQRGMIAAPQFIPVAEDTGAVVALGQFVLNQACQTLKTWNRKHFGGGKGLYVSVNVSPRQFEGFTVNEQIKAALEHSQLEPECLAIEITESLCIRNIESTIISLQAIREHGVSVFLDDFGTGYSSLSHLVNLPLSLVKIDRAFVREMLFRPELDKLIRGIVSLTQGLDLQLTAEGIEEIEQQQRLRSMGVSYGQGFYYSHPLPEHEFEALLLASRKAA